MAPALPTTSRSSACRAALITLPAITSLSMSLCHAVRSSMLAWTLRIRSLSPILLNMLTGLRSTRESPRSTASCFCRAASASFSFSCIIMWALLVIILTSFMMSVRMSTMVSIAPSLHRVFWASRCAFTRTGIRSPDVAAVQEQRWPMRRQPASATSGLATWRSMERITSFRLSRLSRWNASDASGAFSTLAASSRTTQATIFSSCRRSIIIWQACRDPPMRTKECCKSTREGFSSLRGAAKHRDMATQS
mmetsp:Transcript_88766/g.211929  ORF Transcript_88766/g.211929 Transcript_88766/m.211929 type:complete len:250 (-) Transcript_88766:166-915(-)